jgi:hexosaminidase
VLLEQQDGTVDLAGMRISAPDELGAEASLLGAALGLITAADGEITLSLDDELGPEAYALDVTAQGVAIVGGDAAGACWGAQTLRQLLPPATLAGEGGLVAPLVHVEDAPRFGWRGYMVDVARHFFTIEDLERQVEVAALHKVNRLHVHLTDDQGWRLEIPAWPRLTEVGGASEVDGGEGGWYTTEDWASLVAFAAARHVVVVPEIDLPGHAGAALAAYPELGASGEAVELSTSAVQSDAALSWEAEATPGFVSDVLAEVARQSPGAWLHVGADEVDEISEEDYASFVQLLRDEVVADGRTMVGWDEIGRVELEAPFLAQHWRDPDRALAAAEMGGTVIASPAEHTYLDLVYDGDADYGQVWAGAVNVEKAYAWDPTDEGLLEAEIAGVEGCLWTEYIDDVEKVDFMTWPRLAALAEVGWTAAADREWADFGERVSWDGARLEALGIGYYRSPELDWAEL